MAQLTRSTKISGGTTLQSNTLARAVDVETDILTLFNAHNNHDAGTSKWQIGSFENATSTVVIANNSTGTNNILEARDNGTAVLTIADGGIITALAAASSGTTLTATAANGGTGKALIANNGTSTGNIFEAQDNGSAVHTIADGGNQTFTGKMLGPNGTKTVPTYSFSGDPDNGLFLNAANNPAISANDTLVISALSTGVAVKGTTTNDSASAGFIGEYTTGTQTATNTPSSTNYGDLTSISLTAGDWDVSGTIQYSRNTATWVGTRIGISTTSGNSASGLTSGDTLLESGWASTSTAVTENPMVLPAVRMSLGSTTTVYLKMWAGFSAGQPQAAGRLSARRVR